MLYTANIPQELQDRPQWVCWKWTEKPGGGKTKTPVNPRTLKNASSTNPEDWTSYIRAINTWKAEDDIAGIGFVFTAEDSYIGVDFDDCVANGTVTGPEAGYLSMLNSYAEISPSGEGFKVIFRGAIPDDVSRRGFGSGNGIYESGRFFTITGNTLEGYGEIREVPEEKLRFLMDEWFPKQERGNANWEATGEVLTDAEVLSIAAKAANGDAFTLLYRGDYEAAGYPSQSEADAALCTMLAFYTGPNPDQIDRLFRRSGMMRTKWDDQRGHTTYGNLTIENVLDNMDAYFTPKSVAPSTHPGEEGMEVVLEPRKAVTSKQAKKSWQRLIEGYEPLTVQEMPKYLALTVKHLQPIGACFPTDWLEMSSIGFLSTLFRGRKFQNLPLNIWTIGISRQGTGKSVVADELDAITRKAAAQMGLPTEQYTSGSAAGLVRRLAENSTASMLAYFSELSGFLKNMKADHSSSLPELLMDLYDGRNVTHQLANETIKVKSPYMAINGVTTPASWSDTAEAKDMNSGLFSRFMFIMPDIDQGAGFSYRASWQRDAVAEAIGQHIDGLVPFHTIEFTPAAEAIYNAYEEKLGLRGKSGMFDMDNALLTADDENLPSGRLAARVKKVSSIMALLGEQPRIKADTLYVDVQEVQLAIRMVQRGAAFAVRAFSLLSRSRDQQDAAKVRACIEREAKLGNDVLTMMAIMDKVGLNYANAERAANLLVDEGFIGYQIANGRKVYFIKEA